MRIYAQLYNTPGEPTDQTVIAIVEGELWDVPNAPGVEVWHSIEVTQDTGPAQIGDRYEDGKFKHV